MVNFISQNNNIGFVYLAKAMSDVCGKAACTVCCSVCFSFLSTLVGFVWIVDLIKERLKSNRLQLFILDSMLFEMHEFCHYLWVDLILFPQELWLTELRIRVHSSVYGYWGNAYKMEVLATRLSTGSCELSGKCELNASSEDNSLSLMSACGMLAK